MADTAACPATFQLYDLRTAQICVSDVLTPPSGPPRDSIHWYISTGEPLADLLPPGVRFVAIRNETWADQLTGSDPGPYPRTVLRQDIANRAYLYSDFLSLFGRFVGAQCDEHTAGTTAPQNCLLRARLSDDVLVTFWTSTQDAHWPPLDADYTDTWPAALRALEDGFARVFRLPEG